MPRTSTQAIVLHCTATLAHQDFRKAEIEAMHKKRGFREIGYHYLITLDGKVEVGRAPDTSVGAHVQNFNDRTLGVAYVGGLRSSDAAPMDTRTPAQLKAMGQLVRDLCKKYPKAVVLGHRDLSVDLDRDGKVEPHEWMKVCPCFDAGAWALTQGLPGGVYRNGRFDRLPPFTAAPVSTKPVSATHAAKNPALQPTAPASQAAPPVSAPPRLTPATGFWAWLVRLFTAA